MIPRSEYPRPQFEREGFMNLNGEWDFCIDNERSGRERGFYLADAAFDRKITVPFCPESELSGVNHKDFMYGVWYKRAFALTGEQAAKRTVLHIGAADYKTLVFVNGKEAGSHEGGYVSFEFDITALVSEGENTVTVYCEDDTRSKFIPSGKQSERFGSYGCLYTRTTGIWQTVWLEFTEKEYIESVKFFPDAQTGSVTISAKLCGKKDFSVKILYEGKEVGARCVENAFGEITFGIELSEKHLWEIGCGRLYDAQFTFGSDKVKSYFGLRSIALDGKKFLLNGKPIFMRLVLDQGFYPDGIYTAPSDEALKNDILLSKAVGFNGARLHEKVFEERFLYHCDKEGYIVWGEYPNWGLDHTDKEAVYHILPEWLEEIKRDFNHPAIIGWCPFNETWDINGSRQENCVLELIYKATKAADGTRPCIDTSGNYHVVTDIYDVHDYNQNPETFKENYDKLFKEGELYDQVNNNGKRQEYKGGCPVFISEYGGIRWSVVNDGSGWGYGNAPKAAEEFIERYRGLTTALLENPDLCGFCYTQLTDVEQEQNGIYTYYRKEKFDSAIFKAINTQPAAAEK